MNERIDLREMEPLIEEMLTKNGSVTLTVAGMSMQPMIYHRRDTFTLERPEFPLKKYDLPLYKREDGSFILHRIIKVHKDGSYTCRGDNQRQKEYPVLENQIIGVVKKFTRNGKEISVEHSLGYFLYTRTWAFFRHFKKYYKYVSPIIRKMKK